MILPLVYFCFEEQREIYSDRKNRLQVRFQVLVLFSHCPSHIQSATCPGSGEKEGEMDMGRELAFNIITFFYGMKYGVKVSLASSRP